VFSNTYSQNAGSTNCCYQCMATLSSRALITLLLTPVLTCYFVKHYCRCCVAGSILSFAEAASFGGLVTSTDPVAVLAILGQLRLALHCIHSPHYITVLLFNTVHEACQTSAEFFCQQLRNCHRHSGASSFLQLITDSCLCHRLNVQLLYVRLMSV
jgi:hypothetical protein